MKSKYLVTAVVVGFVLGAMTGYLLFRGDATGGEAFLQKASFRQGMFVGNNRQLDIRNDGSIHSSSSATFQSTLTFRGEVTLANCGTASYTLPALGPGGSATSTASTTVTVSGLAIGDMAFMSWTPQSATGTLYVQNINSDVNASSGVAVVSFSNTKGAAPTTAIATGTIKVCYFD